MKQVKHIKVKNQMNRIICCDPMRAEIIEADAKGHDRVLIGSTLVKITDKKEDEDMITIKVAV